MLLSLLSVLHQINLDATISITQSTNGTCTAALMDVIYTPDYDFCGTDSFTYAISDSSEDYVATVTVNVVCPPMLNDDYAETVANTTISINVLDNDEYIPPGKCCKSCPSNEFLHPAYLKVRIVFLFTIHKEHLGP